MLLLQDFLLVCSFPASVVKSHMIWFTYSLAMQKTLNKWARERDREDFSLRKIIISLFVCKALICYGCDSVRVIADFQSQWEEESAVYALGFFFCVDCLSSSLAFRYISMKWQLSSFIDTEPWIHARNYVRNARKSCCFPYLNSFFHSATHTHTHSQRKYNPWKPTETEFVRSFHSFIRLFVLRWDSSL